MCVGIVTYFKYQNQKLHNTGRSAISDSASARYTDINSPISTHFKQKEFIQAISNDVSNFEFVIFFFFMNIRFINPILSCLREKRYCGLYNYYNLQ